MQQPVIAGRDNRSSGLGTFGMSEKRASPSTRSFFYRPGSFLPASALHRRKMKSRSVTEEVNERDGTEPEDKAEVSFPEFEAFPENQRSSFVRQPSLENEDRDGSALLSAILNEGEQHPSSRSLRGSSFEQQQSLEVEERNASALLNAILNEGEQPPSSRSLRDSSFGFMDSENVEMASQSPKQDTKLSRQKTQSEVNTPKSQMAGFGRFRFGKGLSRKKVFKSFFGDKVKSAMDVDIVMCSTGDAETDTNQDVRSRPSGLNYGSFLSSFQHGRPSFSLMSVVSGRTSVSGQTFQSANARSNGSVVQLGNMKRLECNVSSRRSINRRRSKRPALSPRKASIQSPPHSNSGNETKAQPDSQTPPNLEDLELNRLEFVPRRKPKNLKGKKINLEDL